MIDIKRSMDRLSNRLNTPERELELWNSHQTDTSRMKYEEWQEDWKYKREAKRHEKSSEKWCEIGLPEQEDGQQGVEKIVLEFSRTNERYEAIEIRLTIHPKEPKLDWQLILQQKQ